MNAMRTRLFNITLILLAALFAVQCVGVAPLPERVVYPEGVDPDRIDGGGGSDPGEDIEFVDTPNDPSADPTGTWPYDRLTSLGHPRLLMSEEDFDALKEKITTGRETNLFLYKIHSAIIKKADNLVSKPNDISYTLDASGKRLLPMCKAAVESIWHTAYAYKTTGDRKYLDEARRVLNIVCAFPDWHPSHYLDVGEMALAVAIGYDWLYYDLSYEERLKAEQCVMSFAMDTYKGQGFCDPTFVAAAATSNWNQVCFCGLGCAAIAFYDKDKTRCKNLLEDLYVSNKHAIETIYSPTGTYPEGYTYWSYGTGFQVVLLSALEHAFGTDKGLSAIEGFLDTGKYMLFMGGAIGKPYSYSDASQVESGKVGMWYFAAKNNDLGIVANEVRLFNKLSSYPGSADQSERIFPAIPAMTKNLTLGDLGQSMPKDDMYICEEGPLHLMLVHTGWRFNSNDKYLGFKGGCPNYSHAHMDVGSFVYDAYGYRWSDDLGMETYTTMESKLGNANVWNYAQDSKRWTVYRLGAKSHSIFTINGAGQNISGIGKITNKWNTDNIKGAKMNLTSLYSDEAANVTRQIRLEGDDLVIMDYIEARNDKAANIEWRMMTPATVIVETGGITLQSGGVQVSLTASFSDSTVKPTYNSWAASGQYTWEKVNTGMTVAGYTCTIPKGKAVTITTKLVRKTA